MLSSEQQKTPDLYSEWNQASTQMLSAFALLFLVGFRLRLGVRSGYLAVDILLVVSGFAFCHFLLDEIDATGSFSIRKFCRRLFALIYPPILVMLATTSIANFGLGPITGQKTEGTEGLATAAFISNWLKILNVNSYFHPSFGSRMYSDTWAISLVFQLLMISGLIFGALTNAWFVESSQRKRVVGYIVWMMGIGGCVFAAFLSNKIQSGYQPFVRNPNSLTGSITTHISVFIFYSPFTRAWQFFAGAMLATLLRKNSTSKSISKNRWKSVLSYLLLGCSIALLLNSSSMGSVNHNHFFSRSRIQITVGALAFLASTFHKRYEFRFMNRFRQFAASRIFVIYLFLSPVVYFSELLIGFSIGVRIAAFLVCIGIAETALRIVRAMNLQLGNNRSRNKWSFPFTKVFIFAVCGILVNCFAVSGTIARDVFRLTPPTQATNGWDSPVAPCRFISDASGDLFKCNADDSLGQVVLIGDSHAMGLAAGFGMAARSAGQSWSVDARPGCSFAIFASAPQNVECEKWLQETIQLIKSTQPKIVFVFQCSRLRTGCPQLDFFPQIEDEFIDGVSKAINQIRLGQTKVVLLEDTPSVDLGSMSRSLLAPRSLQRVGVLPFFQEQLESVLMHYKKQLIEPGLVDGFVKMSSVVCQPESCKYIDDLGLPIWFDSDHLSLSGSLQFSEAIKIEIDALNVGHIGS